MQKCYIQCYVVNVQNSKHIHTTFKHFNTASIFSLGKDDSSALDDQYKIWYYIIIRLHRYVHLVFVAWVWVVCLMCAPRGTGAAGPRAEGVHVGWATSAHVTNAM